MVKNKKRALPVTTEKVKLDGAYEGWEFDMRTNIPFGSFCDSIAELESTPNNDILKVKESLYNILAMLLISWNFVDEKGEPIPCNKEGFNLVPFDLLNLTILTARSIVETVPKVKNGKL